MVLAVLCSGCACWGSTEGDVPAVAPQVAARHAALRFASGRHIQVDVVDTPASREKGLMFRKSLPKDYGMLFVFPMEMGLNFWMKNTWTSLDIVFIGQDRKITVVHERVPRSTQKTTDEEVARVGGTGQYVLELPAGAARRYKLKAGQQLEFDVPIPAR
jgi:uncharacterized membrane protein (UPF0127 family)